MGMSLGGKDGKRPSPNVNVTPLVDVALVVLIIFMVVTPLMTKTFWLNLPPKPDEAAANKPPKKDSKREPLVLTIDHDGVIRANKTVLTREDIPERLPGMIAAKNHKVLYFDAHDDVPYGTAVEVMDMARAASARTIAILTDHVAQ